MPTSDSMKVYEYVMMVVALALHLAETGERSLQVSM